MTNLKSLAVLSCVSLLTACGGSSSSTNSTTTPTPTPQPVLNSLKIKVIETDKCGNQFAPLDAIMVIHNDDFSAKEVITADANGVLSFDSELDNETITIAMKAQADDTGNREILMNTLVQQPTVDMGEQKFLNYQINCGCEEIELFVNGPYSENARYRIDGDFGGHIRSNDFGIGTGSVKICPDSQGNWQNISSIATYLDRNEVYGRYDDSSFPDFSQFATEQGQAVNIASNDPNARYYGYTYINGVRHLSTSLLPQPHIIPYENADYYRVAASDSNNESELDDNGTWLTGSNYINKTVTDSSEIHEFNFGDNQLLTMKDHISTGERNYDFTQSASQNDYIHWVSLYALDNNYERYAIDWRYRGPLSGELPKLEQFGIDDFLELNNVKEKTVLSYFSFILMNHQQIQDYPDYISKHTSITAKDLADNTYSTLSINNAGFLDFPVLPEQKKAAKQTAKADGYRQANLKKKLIH